MKSGTVVHTHNILMRHAVGVVLAACLSVACSTIEEQESGGMRDMSAVFTLTVSDTNPSQASRAPGHLGDDYDRGEGYENYIDVAGGNYRFYLFDAADRYVAGLKVEDVIAESVIPGAKTYRIETVIPAGTIDAKPLKIVAMANWPDYADESTLLAGVTSIDDINSNMYDFSASKMTLSESNTIPLYGIGRLQVLSPGSMNRIDAGIIHMLRAYAKVEVRRNPDCPYTIESVSVSRYSSRGYCAPDDVYDESDYVHDSYDKDYTAAARVPAGADIAGSLSLSSDDGGETWTGYIPEYINKGRLENQKSNIHIRFAGADAEDIVHFKYYVDGMPSESFDIMRNYWYVFTVNKTTSPLVQIVPYNEVDLRPEYGLLIGVDLVPVRDENSDIIYWFDPDSGQYYGLDKQTPINNPFLIDRDPVNGWSIVRDDNYQFICYHDIVNNIFYASDRVTRLKDPFANVDTSTGWLIILDYETNKIYYYFDREHSRWYLPDKTTIVINPFAPKN